MSKASIQSHERRSNADHASILYIYEQNPWPRTAKLISKNTPQRVLALQLGANNRNPRSRYRLVHCR